MDRPRIVAVSEPGAWCHFGISGPIVPKEIHDAIWKFGPAGRVNFQGKRQIGGGIMDSTRDLLWDFVHPIWEENRRSGLVGAPIHLDEGKYLLA